MTRAAAISSGVRPCHEQMARPLPGVRRLGLALRNGGVPLRGGRRSGQKGARARVQPLAECGEGGGGPLLERSPAARPGARRRRRRRRGGAARRRARDRQVDLLLQVADALGREGLDDRLRERRGVATAAAAAGRAARLRGRGVLVAGETVSKRSSERWKSALPILLVDSIQALRSAELESPPGTVSQVRHCANRLTELAKRSGLALFLVGHITKGRGRSPVRSRSSISSTPCSPSKGITAASTASCGRRRTGSARPARWRSSRCTTTASRRSPTPPGSCSPGAAAARPARRSPPASRGRGRCSSRCRRS